MNMEKTRSKIIFDVKIWLRIENYMESSRKQTQKPPKTLLEEIQSKTYQRKQSSQVTNWLVDKCQKTII